MRFMFYNKLFSGLSISLALSFIIGKMILKSNMYFIFTASFFGAVYLLLGWINYLKLDGVTLFKKHFSLLDRFSYKKKGVYNADEYDDVLKNEELPADQAAKAAMYAYILCGVILLLGAQIIPSLDSALLSPNRNMFPR